MFAVAKTFWPKRSVALPTMAVDATGSNVVALRLEQIQARLTTLERELREVRERQTVEVSQGNS